jgi:hypothetical protein
MPTFKDYTGNSINNEYSANSRLPYANPFFDLSKLFIPKNIKSMFRYCRIFFYTFEYISNVIQKLSEYPVTDMMVIPETESKEIKEKWETYLNKTIHIKRLLQEIGLDYHVFGNCFVSANSRYTRFLKCGKCSAEIRITKPDFKWKFINFTFKGHCPECKQEADFIIKDQTLRNEESLRFIRWAPESMIIKFDPYLNDSRYFYQVPAHIERGIRIGDRIVLETIPAVFIEAVKAKRAIELSKTNIYHFKRPVLAEEDMAFSKPLILPAMKKIYYMQTLQRANEAIAAEHIIPQRVMYPQSTPNLDVYTGMNLANYKGAIEEQILKWRRDSNYIAIMPVPIGYQQIGGDGKNLLLTSELKFLQDSVITSLGVPLEFVQGGAQWTGASVSLRLMGNFFLNYRELLHDFLNEFFIPKSIALANMPRIKEIRMQKFRMADDPVYQQLLINLNAANKISDDYLLTELNVDAADARAKLLQELKGNGAMILEETAKIRARADGEAGVLMARYQSRAAWEQQMETMRLMEQPFSVELALEVTQKLGDITVSQDNVSEYLHKMSVQLSLQDPELQAQTLLKLQQTCPTMYMFLMQRLQNLQNLKTDPNMISAISRGSLSGASGSGNNMNGKARTSEPNTSSAQQKAPSRGIGA